MKLREWDYNHGGSGGWVDVEYPDDVIKKFVDWFRVNKQWRERDDTADMVYRRFLHFERDLTDARNAQALIAAAAGSETCTAETKTGRPCKNTHYLVDGICPIHRKALVTA